MLSSHISNVSQAAMACHMALSPKDVIFVNIRLRDIGIKVWISCYSAISVTFRTVHSSDFFDLECSALFALPCLLNFQSQTALDTPVRKISSHRHLCVLKSQSWTTLFTKFSVSNNPVC